MGRASGRKTKHEVWERLKPAVISNPDYNKELDGEVFKNSAYTVFRRKRSDGTIHLSIRRNDRQPCRDWRDFQHIKNELCGPEWEGLELYPAQSRLVDAANQYHLWCTPERLPFGFNETLVAQPGGRSKAKQRSLPKGWEPNVVVKI